jgi:ribonuclease D
MSRRAGRPRRGTGAARGGPTRGIGILEGWRFEEFGRDALDLVEGRLAFAIREGKLVMTRTESETVA